MSRFIVDACVAVKWMVAEEHSVAALRFAQSDAELLVPDLFFPEVGNVLWKKVVRGQLDAEDARLALAALLALESIESHAMRPLAQSAIELSLQLGCSVYDGVYLALAVREDCPLVTADRKFFNTLQNTPLAGRLLWIEAFI